PGAQVHVDGDGTHFSAVVVSELFAGKSLVQQHQLVYKTLGDKVGSDIHALTIKTMTPEEWENFKGSMVV
ncbi:MAG: BolA/IbaG family iron-sulfur metabolism protein, partial [Gammaproteobacteria bacterium]|nr:BolA/IbaG family iron-sulfur metabolism protein [Gammaproteobacteria bacterium]NIO61398.1 BolA/IbaG family iron-sulfur metabolism protein [Gammaproteobacteria bacterium]